MGLFVGMITHSSLYVLWNSGASVSAVPVIPESFLYKRKRFWKVIVAMVRLSSWMRTFSLASTAWWRPSDQRRPARTRPVNSSMMRTLPSRTM
jgi:hypothetical protein